MATTIVVPLDGSEKAEEALPWAVALARRNTASLLLASVIEIPMEFGVWSVTRAPAMGDQMNLLMAESDAYLHKLGEGPGDVPFDVIVKLGGASVELAAIIEALDDPVVVMTSHGRTGARRILMGSIATRIVHNARCPVLVARHAVDADREVAPALDRVLVPLDGSEFGEYALSQAISTLGSSLSIHLLRVVELPSFRAGSVLEPDLSTDFGLVSEYLEATRDEADDYLREQAEVLAEAGHTVTTEVRDGRVSEEILNAAKEQRSNVIAMATHGRGGLGRLVFGSVAERVLSESDVPLLLVRPE